MLITHVTKREEPHFVYCVNKKKTETLLFLRTISNFNKYKRLLVNEHLIKKLVTEINA